MKRATLAVRKYRHSETHPYYLDLRAFKQGRKFFRTRAEAEAERMRQLTLRERGGREAIGLPLNELSTIVEARKKLAAHGKGLADAAAHYLDYLERIERCNITVAQLIAELLEAKRKDGRSTIYLKDLRHRLTTFSRDFGSRPIAGVAVDELDDWLRNLNGSPKTRANFRGILSVLFGYAERRRMIEANSVARTG